MNVAIVAIHFIVEPRSSILVSKEAFGSAAAAPDTNLAQQMILKARPIENAQNFIHLFKQI